MEHKNMEEVSSLPMEDIMMEYHRLYEDCMKRKSVEHLQLQEIHKLRTSK